MTPPDGLITWKNISCFLLETKNEGEGEGGFT
jgi:hypothetical protein